MGLRKRVEEFLATLGRVTSPGDLEACLDDLTARMGYDFYALTHHVDILNAPQPSIRLHNYPAGWVEYFDGNALGAVDPVHRASQLTSLGFDWGHVPNLIAMTRADWRILELAGMHGIGSGYTVPANVPGEAHGSCSFATVAGKARPRGNIALAQLVGIAAFEAARRIWRVRQPGDAPIRAVLTDRQRDCLIWAARGKSDWETSVILHISEDTVSQHIQQACERYGVQKRTSLMVHALFDGTISFADITGR